MIRFAVWAALASTLIFALCAAQWAYPVPLGLAAAAAAAFAWRWPRPSVEEGLALPSPKQAWPLLAALPFAAVYLVNALAPEISPDGAGYHLGLVRRILEHHGFRGITPNLYSLLPQGLEMLFLPAYALAGGPGAAMVHLAFVFASAALLARYSPVAALLFFVSPVVGIAGASAYVDVGLAFVALACFHALERAGSHRPTLIAAGLLAGFAMSIKYTGAVLILYALIRAGRGFLWVALPAAVVPLPWLVRNWIIAGNPLAPFFNRLFPNPWISAAFEDAYSHAMRHYGGQAINWSTPLELTVRGGILQGAIGPVFLLTPIALLALRDPLGRRALAAAALMAAPWLANNGTRFLIPALPFAALALAIALAKVPRAGIALALANAVLCWPWVMPLYCEPYAWRINRFPLRVGDHRQWLAGNAPDVRFAWLLEEHSPPGSVIYTAQPIMEAYTSREVRLNYTSTPNLAIEAALKGPDPAVGMAEVKRQRITHLFLHDLEPLGPRVAANPAAWSLDFVAAAPPMRLYAVR